MPHPEIQKFSPEADKHYLKYNGNYYFGPYTEESDCDRTSDMLIIKLAIDGGCTTAESLADLDLVYPLSDYYKTEKLLASFINSNVSLEQFICFLKEGGAHHSSNSRLAAEGNQQQQQQQVLPRAQVPNRPKPAPYSPTSLATTTPGKKSVPIKRGANEVTQPLLTCRKNPVSGPTYQPPIPETESDSESDDDQDTVSENSSDNDDSEEIERAPKPARKNAFPGLPPLLRPRPWRIPDSDEFIGVFLFYLDNYAEIKFPSTLLPPSSSNSSEHSSETAPSTPLKDITVRSIFCKTELEAALAHDLLLLWCSKGQVAPDPTSLNFPLSELWKEPAYTLVEQARKCATHVELKAFVDELIKSGKLRKLVLSVPAAVGGGGGVNGVQASARAAANKQATTKITRVQGRKIYEELTNSDEEEEDSESDESSEGEEEEEEEGEMQPLRQSGHKRDREEITAGKNDRKKPKWTEEEENVLETKLISKLGKTWWNEIGGGAGLLDLFQEIFEILEGLGYHRSGARAVEAKAMRLKEKRSSEAKMATVPPQKKQQGHSSGAHAQLTPAAKLVLERGYGAIAKDKKAKGAQKEDVPCPYHWTDKEMNILERELIAKLGENWWLVEGRIDSMSNVCRHISEVFQGLGLGYDRGIGAIGNKARKLKAKKKKAAKKSGVPPPKRQQQQQQIYNRRAAAAEEEEEEDENGGESSRAAPAATVPISSPVSAPPAIQTAAPVAVAPAAAAAAAPPPPATVEDILDDIEILLEKTPGVTLSDEDVCRFMTECARNAETRNAWTYKKLRKYADQGKPELMTLHVEGILK